MRHATTAARCGSRRGGERDPSHQAAWRSRCAGNTAQQRRPQTNAGRRRGRWRWCGSQTQTGGAGGQEGGAGGGGGRLEGTSAAVAQRPAAVPPTHLPLAMTAIGGGLRKHRHSRCCHLPNPVPACAKRNKPSFPLLAPLPAVFPTHPAHPRPTSPHRSLLKSPRALPHPAPLPAAPCCRRRTASVSGHATTE